MVSLIGAKLHLSTVLVAGEKLLHDSIVDRIDFPFVDLLEIEVWLIELSFCAQWDVVGRLNLNRLELDLSTRAVAQKSNP